jgi:hypothetical protein
MEPLRSYRELKQDMLVHPKKNYNSNFFEIFDPFLWVESKLKGVSLKELYPREE